MGYAKRLRCERPDMLRKVALLLGVAVLCPTLSFAQGRRGTAGGRARGTGAPVQMDERTVLDLFSAILNLSDSQQQQLHAAFDAAVKTAAPISTQMENNNVAIFEAVKAGKSDDQVKTLVEQQASLSSQMLMLQAQTFSKTWAVLSSDQKARFDDLLYDDIGQFLANAKLSASPGPGLCPNTRRAVDRRKYATLCCVRETGSALECGTTRCCDFSRSSQYAWL